MSVRCSFCDFDRLRAAPRAATEPHVHNFNGGYCYPCPEGRTEEAGDKAEAPPKHRMGPPAWEPGLAHDEWANRCVTCHELWPCAGDKAEAPLDKPCDENCPPPQHGWGSCRHHAANFDHPIARTEP